MVTIIKSRWLRAIGPLFAIWLATACQPLNVDFQLPTASPAVEAAAAESTTSTLEPMATLPPGPTPTHTPEPMTEPDTERAARLTEDGETLYLESDLAGAESAFIDAISADQSHLPAYIGLTRTYLYQPQYWQQALETANSAVTLAPDDPSVLAYLAWVQQSAHHFDDAKETALRSVELGPENALAHTALADVLASMYEMDKAYDHAQRAVALENQLAIAWVTLGSIESLLHNWGAAGAAYVRAVELEPEFFAWHLTRADHELDITGDIVSASGYAEPALESQPDHAWTLFFLSNVAIDTNDWDTAEASCQRLMILDQAHTLYPDAYACMASVLIRQDRYQEAERYQLLAESRATSDRRDITLVRMRLYNEREECEQSRALAQDWLEARPYSVTALRMIGTSYLCEDDYEEAATYYRQAYDVLPRSVSDARMLAVAYAYDDKAAEAKAVLNEIASFAIEDPTYYQARFEVLLNLGEAREALTAAQRWQVLRPDDTEPSVSIAFAHLLLGNTDAARSTAEYALKEGENSAILYTVLGESLRRQGEVESAEEYLLQAVALNENHFLARYYLAALFFSSNRCASALPHLHWLLGEMDEEGSSEIAEILRFCEERLAATPTPVARGLDDDAATQEVRDLVLAAGALPHLVILTEIDDQWGLALTYSTDLKVDSGEFTQLERRLVLELAPLLPRIASEPGLLAIVSGSGGEAQFLTIISTEATIRWLGGQLTDKEFEESWLRQRVDE